MAQLRDSTEKLNDSGEAQRTEAKACKGGEAVRAP